MVPFHLIFAAAIAIVGIAFLLGILFYYRRKVARNRHALLATAQRLSGSVSGKSTFTGELLEGNHGGIPFTCRHFMGSRNSPPSLTIRVRVPCPAKMTIRREAWYDRFAKRIGLVAEPGTGDPLFDGTYFIDTARGDVFQPCLLQEAKRREIQALFSLGFPVQEIVFEKNGLRVVLSPIEGDAIASVPLEKYLDALVSLSEGLAPAGPVPSSAHYRFPGSPRPPIPRAALASLFTFHGLLIAGGTFALAWGMHQYEPLGDRLILNALALSAAAALVFLVLAFRWIQGRSSSHRLYLIVLILSLIGFPLGVTGGAVLTNGLLDAGDETSRQVSVTKRYYRQNKNTRTYYVAFASWQRPGETDRIAVDADFYRTVRQGDGIVIRTKPGYWQEDWIAGIARAPGADRQLVSSGIPLRPLAIRFYESGRAPMPQEDRRFAVHFARQTARFIHCRLDMENDLWQESDRGYTFGWQYVNSDGSLQGDVSLPFTIKKQWKTTWVSHSWGWDEPGRWPPGDYRVIVLVDGRPLGESTFSIR